MPHDDFSISNNSIFDWGSLPGGSSGSGHGDGGEGQPAAAAGGGNNNNKPLARYDPNGMIRITDITDLVDDSSGDDSDDDIIGSDVENGRKRKRLGGSHSPISALCCRQVIMLVELVGIIVIIVGACVALGYAVLNAEPNNSPYTAAAGPEGGNVDVPSANETQQHMLEIAERVVTACSENKLDEDMTQCQQLCHGNMCCFESGEYSCEDDETKDCAVYAGCEALIIGVPMEAADEDEK